MTPCRDPSPQKRPRASGTRNSLSLSLFVKLLAYAVDGPGSLVGDAAAAPGALGAGNL